MLQMIYTSAATKKFSQAELKELLQKARANNVANQITGMLLYEDGTFLQVLEGDDEVVQKTYERIANDPRHNKILLIARFEVEHRTFTDWEMGFFDASGGQLLELPGYTNFLNKKTVELEEVEEGDKAREVLINFKQGAWHRAVPV
ncbi:MAG: BLUF domain-containing protein [Planctomycetota bacterium]